MIEYFYDAIKASSGESIIVKAVATQEDGTLIAEECSLFVYDKKDTDKVLFEAIGNVVDDVWEFVIPPQATEGLHGRYWYTIKYYNNSLCFKAPLYLV